MLVTCPECSAQISDKALFCPHCGYTESNKPIRFSTRRKRLPNGFGQISEIKGKNLRNPYRVMVPAGKGPNGRPISKLLQPQAYFKTYNDAYMALVEYNKSPYDPQRDPLFKDLYEEWLNDHKNKIEKDSTLRQYKSCYDHLESLHNYHVSQIKAYHIREAIETSDASIALKNKMKALCNMLFDYATEREIVQRNYARELRLSMGPEKTKEIHIPYTDAEIKTMWENVSDPAIFAQLLQCYTGFRPQEVLLIALNDIDLDQMTITGGMKTDAGRNRIVPIHPQLYDLIKEKYNKAKSGGFSYLINGLQTNIKKSEPITYGVYSKRLKDFWRTHGTAHRPHDGRVHFITMAKKYNLDEYAVKKIVGHAIKDLTERVYTKRDVGWLRDEISKIPPGEFYGLKI